MNQDIQIPKEILGDMLHTLGIEHDRRGNYTQPNKTYRPKLKAYRNHYMGKNEGMKQMCRHGLVFKYEKTNPPVYGITDKGIQHIRDLGYRFEVTS